MFGNIKKNNVRGLGLKLRNDKYFDFMLYKGECYSDVGSSKCISMGLDARNIEKDGTWVSTYTWQDAVNNGVELSDIGYTGTDNGFIFFRGDRVNKREFLDVLTGSTYIPEGLNMTLKPVSGCTMRHTYPYEVNDGYVSLKGGFFQGFYKVEGQDYQVLPNILENDWNLEFVIRRKDYVIPEDSILTEYPENKGIFFYMGTRAENKFSLYYDNTDEYIDTIFEDLDEGYISDGYDGGKNPDGTCSDNCPPFDGEYIVDDIVINADTLNDLKTKDGFGFGVMEYEAFETDNKHLFFNRTATGYTVDTWDENIDAISFTDIKRGETENKFLLFNNTATGYTVDTADQIPTVKKGYDIIDDLKNNAFALIINENGSIGYRYGVLDCESDDGYSVIVEASKPNMVTMDEWTTINVRISNIGGGKMKIYVYVNGNLVLVSKPLPIFNFRGLNDVASKQQGVPYNISIGGGTQGLFDGIWLQDIKVKDEFFPLMKDFGGCFIGDVRSFRFYDCFRHYSDIKNTVLL